MLVFISNILESEHQNCFQMMVNLMMMGIREVFGNMKNNCYFDGKIFYKFG